MRPSGLTCHLSHPCPSNPLSYSALNRLALTWIGTLDGKCSCSKESRNASCSHAAVAKA